MSKAAGRNAAPFRFTVDGEEFTLTNPGAMLITDGDLAGGLARMLGAEQYERFRQHSVPRSKLKQMAHAVAAHYRGVNHG